jgi:protein required for attachment to host cells
MKPTKTWILIADGARARVLENDGPGKGLIAIDRLVFQGDHAATHDIVDDREGRTYSSHGPRRSAVDAHTNPHRELKKTFAHHLADILAHELDAGSYGRLVIVAAPVTLGDLRKVLAPKVAAKITGEVNKDLTKTPNSDVAHHLEDVLVT